MRLLRSIKGRLFVWYFILSSLFLLLLEVGVYKEVEELVMSSVDHMLHSKSEIIKGLLHVEHGQIELEMTEIVLGEYAIPRSGYYYKVIMDGRVLAASESLVDPDFDLTGSVSDIRPGVDIQEKLYTSIGPAGEPIRVLRDDFEFLGKKTTVFVAQSLQDSLAFLAGLKRFLLLTVPIALVLIGIGGYWITRYSLLPLERFSDRIEKITHTSLGQRIEEPSVQELKDLAASFNSMLQRLETAFDVEKRLLSDASHELKTPLSVVLAECELALQRERDSEYYRDSIFRVQQKLNMMKRTIDNILTLTRLDSGMLKAGEFEPVSLEEAIKDAIDIIKPFAEQKKVSIGFVSSRDVKIFGDRHRLTEAFLNLLDNAVRYNKYAGSVDVSMLLKDRAVEVTVRDTGMGIEEKDLHRVFDRFYRASSVRNTEGTGLGLSIVKEIIMAHGGVITVESTPGQGSVFTVRFYEFFTDEQTKEKDQLVKKI